MANSIPPRSKVNKKYTWNAESVFKSKKAWDAEVKNILADLPSIKKYEGRLGESAETLVEAFDQVEDLMKRLMHVFMYAGFSYTVDTTNQTSAAMFGKAQSVYRTGGWHVSLLSTLSYLKLEKPNWMNG